MIAYLQHETFCFMMSLRQCPLQLGSASAERVGQREMGGFTCRVTKAWLYLSSAVEKALVGTGKAISLLLCMNGLGNQSNGLVGPPFLPIKLSSQSIQASLAKNHD